MYNRYTPQPDGSYLRSRVQDSMPDKNNHTISSGKSEAIDTPPPAPVCTSPPETGSKKETIQSGQRKSHLQKKQYDSSIGGFLKQLLPENFDTSDLFVVLLLLLMSGDCRDEHNSALLTLALYLFM